nr:hypothetical protein [Streptomyces sp. CBMA156]
MARLEVQKQALERELAAVVAHLGSVKRALDALQALMSSTGPDSSGTPPRGARAAVPRPTRPAAGPADAPAAAGHEDRDTAPESVDEEGAPKQYGRLTEQILDYFTGAGDVEVRARDVAEALGRATDSGSINAVRSTLDRLVASSRVRRAGRGLYRAV